MNLNEVTEVSAAPEFAKYLKAAERQIKSELNSYFKQKPSPKLEVSVKSPYAATISIDFQNFMHPADIDAADENFKDALKKADVNGHIHKLETGNSVGSNFVEVVLSGLKPGMTVKAEAFFPYLAFEVTFKQIVSRRG